MPTINIFHHSKVQAAQIEAIVVELKAYVAKERYHSKADRD